MATLKIQPGDQDGHFVFTENMDEFMDLLPLKESPHSHLVLNLNGIYRINSMGIKKWVETLRELLAEGKKITYVECSEVVVEMCNISLAFVMGVEIHSFEVTLGCENCEVYVSKIFTREEVEPDLVPPEIPCPECGRIMELEEEDLLDFLEESTT